MTLQSKSMKVGLSALLLLSLFNLAIILYSSRVQDKCKCQLEVPLWEQFIDFLKRNYSNETGVPTGQYLVPNFVHFVRFNDHTLSYTQMICILSAFKNQKPDKIFFHVNFNTTFEGKYWEVLEKTKGFMDTVVFNFVPIPTEIFGQRFNYSRKYAVFHAADVTKLQMLMKYGGIALDLDVYIINSLNQYRVFEFTLNWEQNRSLACQLLIAHKDSRFLKLYLESYRNAYDGRKWYYNAGHRPTKEILLKKPELVHRVKGLFGAKAKYIEYLFGKKWNDWRAFRAMHLLIRHQYLLKNLTRKATFPVDFNEQNIVYYPITFREMAYDVYNIAGIAWPKYRKNRKIHIQKHINKTRTL